MSAGRRRWIPWVAVAAVAGVTAVFVVAPMLEHRNAERRYEAARIAWNEARDAWEQQHAEWDDAHQSARAATDLAAAVTSEQALPYLDDELAADAQRLVGLIDDAIDAVPDAREPDATAPDPETTDELIDAAEALDEQEAAYTDAAGGYAEAAEALTGLVPELEGAIGDLRASIPEQAAAIEEANISSSTESRIRLYYAAETAATSDDSVDYYVDAYAEAAAAVEQSQRDELAEKDQGDGLLETRLEVEEFVRSITGGVRVDFDWEPVVNGLGDGESAGGRVTWQYLDGGSATMELSNSVAAHWPDSRYESLVAHESGHVITAKCQDLLVDTFDGDAELMATAWAIGMGYTDAWGNGVNFYYDGIVPADDLVEATLACR